MPGKQERVLAGMPGVVVGVDLVEVARIGQTVARFGQRFLERVFTPEELQESQLRVLWLAGRFAAKEACAKALGTGIGASAAWREIQVLRQSTGKPALQLRGAAAARAASLGLYAFDLSISHTHEHALAVVVALAVHGHVRSQPSSGPE
jgi:holo-[acyl-carrier protein] synthase